MIGDMSLRDVPGASAVAGSAALVVDVALYGGEIIVSLLVFVVMSPETWLSLALYGERLADRVPGLPEAPIETIVTVGLVLMLVVGLVRLASSFRTWREDRAG